MYERAQTPIHTFGPHTVNVVSGLFCLHCNALPYIEYRHVCMYLGCMSMPRHTYIHPNACIYVKYICLGTLQSKQNFTQRVAKDTRIVLQKLYSFYDTNVAQCAEIWPYSFWPVSKTQIKYRTCHPNKIYLLISWFYFSNCFCKNFYMSFETSYIYAHDHPFVLVVMRFCLTISCIK